MSCFCDSKMDQGFFHVSCFQLTPPKSAAYSQEKGPMSDAANLDKRWREPSTGLKANIVVELLPFEIGDEVIGTDRRRFGV